MDKLAHSLYQESLEPGKGLPFLRQIRDKAQKDLLDGVKFTSYSTEGASSSGQITISAEKLYNSASEAIGLYQAKNNSTQIDFSFNHTRT